MNEQNKNSPPKPKIRRGRFNWKLPWYGAIGFGLSFGLTRGIMLTIMNRVFNGVSGSEPALGSLRGLIVGGLGGAAIGLAFEEKENAVWFSLSGSLGFIIAFPAMLSLEWSVVPDFGRAILEFMGVTLDIPPDVAFGVGEGAIIGGIAGFILGLASPKGRILSAILLSFSGALWFINAFTIAEFIYQGNVNTSWNAIGGAIGGFVFGFALALINWVYDQIKLRRVA